MLFGGNGIWDHSSQLVVAAFVSILFRTHMRCLALFPISGLGSLTLVQIHVGATASGAPWSHLADSHFLRCHVTGDHRNLENLGSLKLEDGHSSVHKLPFWVIR